MQRSLSHRSLVSTPKRPRRALAALLALALACGGGSGGSSDDDGPPPDTGPFGLEVRVPVAPLAFPLTLPDPGTYSPVDAFPSLDFASPVFLTSARDGSNRLFVVEQGGVIRLFDNDPATTTTEIFLDISDRVPSPGTEAGLLGLAFHPNYPTSPWFYVYYSVDDDGPRRTRISRFRVSADPDRADAGSEDVLLEIPQPSCCSNHNGGMLAFGPDGMLYASVGDGGQAPGSADHGQDPSNLLGAILRLEDDGDIPADNPFVGMPGMRGEIWAYGFRNPWRMSFDREEGTLFVGDVGQSDVEEIDIVTRGGNYGWGVYEGDRPFHNPGNLPPSAFDGPIHTYTHAEGQSVTGGYVYRGSNLPGLIGAYVYGDFGNNAPIWALRVENGVRISNTLLANVNRGAAFGEDAAGELYLVGIFGTITRLVENGGGGDPGLPELLSETGLFADTAAFEPAPGLIEYEVNAPLWSDNARKRRFLALPGTQRIGFRSSDAWTFPVGTALVKHFELETAPGEFARLETRVFFRHTGGWQGYTYRWNEDETDAVLLDEAEDEEFTVQDPDAPGGERQQVWHYPSRTQCLACHTSEAGRVLGVRTGQLNRDFAYPVIVDNQLRAWNHIELFDRNLSRPNNYPAYSDPADATASLAGRARSYLAANCAMCHQPGGGTPVDMDLRFETSRFNLRAIDVPAASGGGPRIDPGDAAGSVLYQRMNATDSDRMPPLATDLVDEVGTTAVGAWIDAGAN
ncbi:MAG: PQQ-dependent sugar dehydrogenase [Proteobacteria bacterium]|nr:PQQ-dependent sugar dehydrogenase [Pseudomonadota bacterium]